MKTVNLSLVGINGNAFSLMLAYQHQARKENWTEEEIKDVFDEAKEGDYNHLLCVLDSHCEQ